MPLRGAAELESMLMSRLYHVTNNRITGEDVKRRLEAILEITIKANLVELVGTNQIPQGLIKEELDVWARKMTELGIFGSDINPGRTPQIVLGLRPMTEAIFKNYQPPRVPISPFVQPGVGFRGLRAQKVIRDEALSLELEERSLTEMLVPGTINKEGRRRIGESVQKALADAEIERVRKLEEQKKLDEEEKQIEKTGFGRKVEF